MWHCTKFSCLDVGLFLPKLEPGCTALLASLRALMSAEASDVSFSLVYCGWGDRARDLSPLLTPDTHGVTLILYNVMPRLNELHPYSFISHYQVWINYVCGVSDDNEMMMITLTIISISGPQVMISNTKLLSHIVPSWAEYEKSATSCKLVKTRKIRQSSSKYFHAVLDI